MNAWELMQQQHARDLEALRQRDKDRWIALLESLLLDAEDQALTRGEWGLIDSRASVAPDDPGGFYQSMTCAEVINNIRARHVRERS